MRHETAAYIPLKPPFMLADIEKQLSARIRRELIRDERTVYVGVETKKTDVVEYLDKFFRIGELKIFRKSARNLI